MLRVSTLLLGLIYLTAYPAFAADQPPVPPKDQPEALAKKGPQPLNISKDCDSGSNTCPWSLPKRAQAALLIDLIKPEQYEICRADQTTPPPNSEFIGIIVDGQPLADVIPSTSSPGTAYLSNFSLQRCTTVFGRKIAIYGSGDTRTTDYVGTFHRKSNWPVTGPNLVATAPSLGPTGGADIDLTSTVEVFRTPSLKFALICRDDGTTNGVANDNGDVFMILESEPVIVRVPRLDAALGKPELKAVLPSIQSRGCVAIEGYALGLKLSTVTPPAALIKPIAEIGDVQP